MNMWIDNFLHFPELVQLFRLILAILLGACIGFEREKFGRPAGLRTHMIVCVASALAMLVSVFGFTEGDPARLAAQVISGIGFIGAGAIIRGDKDITGITTAATIFICAIIGLACGNGAYFGAILTTALSLFILTCFTRLESKMSKKRKHNSNLVVIVKQEENTVEKLKEFLNKSEISLAFIEYKSIYYENEKALRISVGFEKHTRISDLNGFLANIDKELHPLQCKITNDGFKKEREV